MMAGENVKACVQIKRKERAQAAASCK